MAAEKRVVWSPKRGHGLVTAYSPHALGELWDSFSVFRNIIIRENAWENRPGDALFFTEPTGQVGTIHPFNFVAPDGSVTSQLVDLVRTGEIRAINSTLETTVSPFEIFFETVKNRVFFAGVNNTPGIYDGFRTTPAPWGANGPTGDLTYIGFKTTTIQSATSASVVTVVNGSPTVNWSSGSTFTTGSAWVGKTITLDGVDYVIQSVTSNHILVLAVNYAGSNATVNAYIHYGNMSWQDAPPQYAIAYYNPETGHVTNVGNTLKISEKNINNVSITVGGIATDATLFAAGYTKIVMFRTAPQGSVLYPFKLQPQASVDADGFIENVAGPLSIIDDDGLNDNNSGAILGLEEAPHINNPAPEMRIIAYHDGRFWGVESERPYRIRFSGSALDIPLGVPEECWPEDFFRDMKSPDGAVLSLKVVGTTLLAGTEGFLYFLIGSDAGSYDFQRISTRGFGVNQYAIDENPGDGSTASASGIYVSSDRRIWRHLEGGTIKDIGTAIQDKLDGVTDISGRRPFFVVVFRLKKFWIAALGVLNSAPGAQAFTAAANGSGTCHVINGSPFIVRLTGTPFDPSWTGQVITVNGAAYGVLIVNSVDSIQLSANYISGATGTAPYLVGAGGGGGGGGGGGTGNGLDYSVFFYDFDQEAWYDWGFSNGPALWTIASAVWHGYGENRVFGSLSGSGQGQIKSLFEGTAHPDGGTTADMATQHWDGGDRSPKKSFTVFRLYVSDAGDYNIQAEFNETGVQYDLKVVDTSQKPGYMGQKVIECVDDSSPFPQWHCVKFSWTIPGIGQKVFKAEMMVNPQSTGESGEPS